jgi:hypothetical protein
MIQYYNQQNDDFTFDIKEATFYPTDAAFIETDLIYKVKQFHKIRDNWETEAITVIILDKWFTLIRRQTKRTW